METARWPGSHDPVNELNKALNEIREDYVRLSLNFIENGIYDDYYVFAQQGASVKDPQDGKTASGSLESIHNNYHDLLGTGGNMSYVETAAFDPIFWIHHWLVKAQ